MPSMRYNLDKIGKGGVFMQELADQYGEAIVYTALFMMLLPVMYNVLLFFGTI